MPTPVPTGPAKVCVACQKDVSRLPRHKDEKGRYLCHECMAAARARAVERREPPKPEPEEAAMAALLVDALEPAAALPCPSCGAAMAAGAVVCTGCGFDSRAGVKSVLQGRRAPKSSSAGETARAAGKVAVGAAKLAAGPAALVMSAVLALIGGLVGAAIWGGIVYTTHYQVGYVAVLVGAIAGVAARVGAGRYVGLLSGLIGAAAAAGAVAGGHYFVVSTQVDSAVKEVARSIDYSEEEMRVELADRVVAEYLAAGKPVRWPVEGMTVAEAYEQADYPADVWKEATRRWDAMGEDQRYALETEMISEARAVLESARTTIKEEGFFESFGVLDLVFYGLAVVVAFGAGAGGSGDD